MELASGSGSGQEQTSSSDKGRRDDGDLRLAGTLRTLDQLTRWAERPVRRVAGSGRLNPLPHAGTISVFLLGVVVITGLYITLFFEFGHEASYQSVMAMENHAIQRVVRALHRYASAALVVTTMVHAWRILTARRFTGRLRRWRWATGVAALILIWLSGVTGYWLVWDTRAQALNEIMVGLGTGVGTAVDQLGVLGGRSGSGFLLLMWFIHLGLTLAVAWFVFRHLRRARLPWLPPPVWMALMGVPLLAVSLLVPVGMLPPADPEALTGSIPLDPFVMFLLPPLLSSWRWVTLGVAGALAVVVTVLPRLIQRRDPPVVAVIESACTGCELCVIDCPYEALSLVDAASSSSAQSGSAQSGSAQSPEADGGKGADREPSLLAVVDPQRCVGCGICLGSCAFGALDLPGTEAPAPVEVAGRDLVVACDRHLDQGQLVPGPGLTSTGQGADDGPVIYPVRCAGALAPGGLRALAERGPTDIQLIGCAPNECRYGIGNTLAAERLSGQRVPHPPARYARRVAQDWVATDAVAEAVAHPGEHPSLDPAPLVARRESLIGVGVIAVVSAVAIAFATQAPFRGDDDRLALRLVVDHGPGQVLNAAPEAGPVGALQVVVTVDGETVLEAASPAGDGAWTDIVDLDLDLDLDLGDPSAGPGTAMVGVTVHPDQGATPVIHRVIEADAGQRIVIDLTDEPVAPGVAEGRDVFTSNRGGCTVCHSVEPGDHGVGPSLAGIATTGATRVRGLDAAGYLRQSILLPDQYVVEGYPAGQMLPIYRDRLTETELEALIAYLLSLEDPSADPDNGSDP